MTQETDPMPVDDHSRSRALILAGGGLKVAYQAGVMQVWLDEAGVKFETFDSTSGGTFNLAMHCQGLTGTQIADKWRSFAPSSGIAANWGGLLRGPFGSSVFSLDKYRTTVFPSWDIDADDLPSSDLHARFNVFNFTQQRLESRLPHDMDEDILVACNSLPFWFPPVQSGDETFLDAVYITDANLEQAINDGADELWVIWTVSRRGTWYDGFIAQYFQTIEEAANGTLRRARRRICANNAAIARGDCGEFGRHIELRLIEAEVPLHYIINLRRDRMAAAVELGVRDARKWCRDRGIPLTSPDPPPAMPESPFLRFSETMRGTLRVGPAEPPLGGVPDPGNRASIALHLTGRIDEIGRFVTDPAHFVRIDGTVDCPALGGTSTIERGKLNLLTFDEDPGRAFFRYRLWLKDDQGTTRTLFGVKYVFNDPGMDLWGDTTTLIVDVWPGFLDERPESTDDRIASGQVKQTLLGFLTQQLTMKTGAKNPWTDLRVRGRFYAFFLGRLFDVYGQKLLSSSPF